jgi:hypothetical protein
MPLSISGAFDTALKGRSTVQRAFLTLSISGAFDAALKSRSFGEVVIRTLTNR